MSSKFEVIEIAKALSEEWGPEAVETDRGENKVYIQFIEEVVTSLTVDCDLGVSHCVADLPNVFPASLAPKDFEDLCVYANRLNITLSRELGVTHHFQVLDDTLKLTDTRSFSGPADIVEICDTQARDIISLMQVVTQSLLQGSGERADVERDIPQNAVFI
jgi:hypothetical protein